MKFLQKVDVQLLKALMLSQKCLAPTIFLALNDISECAAIFANIYPICLTIHLRSLLRKDQPFVWKSEHQTEFDSLKQIMVSPSVMSYHPNWNLPFKVHVDPSKHGVVSMLVLNHNGHIHHVFFFVSL